MDKICGWQWHTTQKFFVNIGPSLGAFAVFFSHHMGALML